jgi:hypothetical protein
MRALLVLNLASNELGELVLPQGWSEGWKADGSAQEYTHTDGSKQARHPGKPEGIIALANAIPNMGAMTSLNLAGNDLGAGGAKIVAEAIKVTKCTPAIILVPFSCPPDFSINCCLLFAIVRRIMGALSVLSLKSNRLRADGGKALTEGLKGNTVITELDISSNDLGEDSNYDQDMSGVIALADVIPGMGALSQFIFSGVTMETSMSVVDFSRKGLGISGAIILSAFLPKCT